MIQGIFETHINVSDVEVSARFYERLPGVTLLHQDTQRKSRFYWIGEHGTSMLGIRENYPSPLVQRQHFAFTTGVEQLYTAAAQLAELGITAQNFHGDSVEQAGELIVFPFMPAVSIYFTDPDGHSLELIAMLPHTAQPEQPLMTWDAWEALQHQG
ncbi:VOC family protein [Paenibacillus hunanensis]|uniref:VOC family protein n=1 Tax=Paenibacillus hunanensis TaxID=539262 RepID=UPI002A6B2462|nr:VOC family protein [Paenibacillus hunanensis]WPP40690.1 VOC family protein [Paenibacillus hunanensis]